MEHTHEAIIDMDTWNACLEVDTRNFKPHPTKDTNKPSLFGGLLRCKDCGFAMRYTQETHTYPKKGFVKYISYLCGNYSRSGKSACSAHIIYLNPLSELVLDDIRRRAKCVLEDKDRVLGGVPEAVFKSLMAKYEAERVAKQELVQVLKQRLSNTVKDERDIEQYLQSIRKYVAIEQLDREMLLELIHYIEIGERQELDGQKFRDVVIQYNLVDKAR